MSCGHCPRRGGPCRGEAVPRLCQLVDPAHPDYRPAYFRILAPGPRAAAQQPEPAPAASGIPFAESIRLTKLARQCPFRSKAACGCSGAAACALKGGIDVSTRACWACVKEYGA